MFRHLSTKRSGQSSKSMFSFGKQLEPLSPLREEAVPQDKGKKQQQQQQQHGKQQQQESNQETNHNWLAEAEARLKEDYEASKKELELTRNVIEELGQRLASMPPDPPPHQQQHQHQHQQLYHKYQRQLLKSNSHSNSNSRKQIRDQKVLMTACQEYSRTRVHLLRQRVRQVAVWADNRRLGQRFPERAPAEWATADREWAQWLAEQAAVRAGVGIGAGAGAGAAGAKSAFPSSGSSWAQQQQQKLKQEERDFTMEHTRLWGPLGHMLEVYTWDHDASGDAERYAELTDTGRT